MTTPYIRTLLAMAGLLLCGFAHSQGWPQQPVKVVVPFAPGGTVDTLSRFLSDRLQHELGQSFIVENRPGAGGSIGTEAVVRAAPDGYTLLLAGLPTHALNPYLYKLDYDPIADLTAIGLVGAAPNLLVVNPGLGVNTVQELLALARAKPGELAFSSAGPGTTGHLAGEILGRQAKLDIRHVPYKGQADAILAVMRGDVAFAFVTIPGTLARVEAGQLKALGITSAERSALAPDIPTFAEAGVPDFVIMAWYSMSAPQGLSPQIQTRLTGALDTIMTSPDTLARFASLGMEPVYLKDDAYRDYLRQESEHWGAVVKAAGIHRD